MSTNRSTATPDPVDQVLADWQRERPDADVSGLGVITRITMLSRVFAMLDRGAMAPIGVKQWAAEVLLALRRQGRPYQLSPTDLRRTAVLSSGAMTNRLDHLERAGLISRRPSTRDHRGFVIQLTTAGRTLADRVFDARTTAVRRRLASLTPAEQRELSGLLRKLLGDMAPIVF